MLKHILQQKRLVGRRTLLKGGIVVGASVLLGTGGTLLWLDTRPDPPLYTFHQDVYGVTWSPTGKRLATLTSEGAFIVWNTSSYTIIYSDQKAGNALAGGAIAWSPNDQYVASSDQNHAVRIWNTTTWSSITDNSTNETFVGALVWSPDSKFVAIGSADKLVRIYRVTTNSLAELVFTYAQHQDEVTTLAWSPDGKYIASGSLDASVHVWSPLTGNAYTTLSNQTTHPITAVIWSPNNQMLALTFGPKEDNLQPMSKYIVQVLQVQSGALISTYSGHRDYIEALAWSPDGTYIASASDDTTVHIWEPKQTQATYIYRGHSARVRKVAWAPDNIHLATASEDKTLQVWKKPQ